MTVMLRLESVSRRWDQKTVVDGVSFAMQTGSIACLLGPSGCGKTTLLRMVAGLEWPDTGRIFLKDRWVAGFGREVLPEDRGIGMVFQDFALFPHLTVAGNIGFGLRKASRKERKHRIHEVLELVGLLAASGAFPHELSGGQQQRVALARALAPGPSLLLMDEPFSSLDARLRERLVPEVRHILKKEGIATLLVTHDQSEAFAMGDEVGVMEGGRLAQWGRPQELYFTPKTPFVASFVGQGRFLEGRREGDAIRTALGPVTVPDGATGKDSVRVLVRPEDVVFDPENGVTAEVLETWFQGETSLCVLQLSGNTRITARFHPEPFLKKGDAVGVSLRRKPYPVFAATEGRGAGRRF